MTHINVTYPLYTCSHMHCTVDVASWNVSNLQLLEGSSCAPLQSTRQQGLKAQAVCDMSFETECVQTRARLPQYSYVAILTGNNSDLIESFVDAALSIWCDLTPKP